ncbi:hypothetical protein ACLBYG_20710 [Methylobacterium sp. D53M]
MRKHFPLNSNGAEDAGQLPWKDGVPSTGVEGSYPGQALFVDTEAEILAAIDASGQARNGSDLTQLVQAIARGLYLGQFTGTANALTAVLANNVAFASLLRGVRFTGYVTATNTTGVTVAITCLTGANAVVQAPLLTKGGNALAAGDLPVNQDFEIRWDGAAFRMVGSVASEGISPSQSLTIVQAAGAPFGLKQYVNTNRRVMSGQGTDVQQSAWDAFTHPKRSANSRLRLDLGFDFRSSTAPGQGNGPSIVYLNVGGQIFRMPMVNSYPGSQALNRIKVFFDGLPAGNTSVSVGFGRYDTAAWAGTFGPTNTDDSGRLPVSTSTLDIDEVILTS